MLCDLLYRASDRGHTDDPLRTQGVLSYVLLDVPIYDSRDEDT